MKKIPTLYKKNPDNLALVIDEVNPGNEWVFELRKDIGTRKFDGTAAAIIDGYLYKRYDVKKGRVVPANSIPCQEPDEITGHWPHWVLVNFDCKDDRYFVEGWSNLINKEDGTYELCGPKINGNNEKLDKHVLIKHGLVKIHIEALYFIGIEIYLKTHDIEGIVFHHPDGRMCKIRKSDFGIKR